MNIYALTNSLERMDFAYGKNQQILSSEVRKMMKIITADDLASIFIVFKWAANRHSMVMQQCLFDSLIEQLPLLKQDPRRIGIITNMLNFIGTVEEDKTNLIKLLRMIGGDLYGFTRDNNLFAKIIKLDVIDQFILIFSPKDPLACVKRILSEFFHLLQSNQRLALLERLTEDMQQQVLEKVLSDCFYKEGICYDYCHYRFTESESSILFSKLPPPTQEKVAQAIILHSFNRLTEKEANFLFDKLSRPLQDKTASELFTLFIKNPNCTRYSLATRHIWYLLGKLSKTSLIEYLPSIHTHGNDIFNHDFCWDMTDRYIKLLDDNKELISRDLLRKHLVVARDRSLYEKIYSSETIDALISLFRWCQRHDLTMDLLLPLGDYYKNSTVNVGEFLYKISKSDTDIPLSPRQIDLMKHGKEALLSYFEKLSLNTERQTFFKEASDKNGQLWKIFNKRRPKYGLWACKTRAFDQLVNMMIDLGLQLDPQQSISPSAPVVEDVEKIYRAIVVEEEKEEIVPEATVVNFK